MINIVGLGYGEIDDLTIRVLKLLKGEQKVFIKSDKHPVIKILTYEGIKFNKYSELHEYIMEHGKINNDVVYAVPGNPSENDELVSLCKEKEIKYKIYEAAGINCFIQECMHKDIDKVDVIDANRIKEKNFNKQNEMAVVNLEKGIINEIKTELNDIYYENTYIYHLKIGEYIKKDKVKLSQIDKIDDLNELSILYIPKCSKSRKDMNDLVKIIEILRSENGCPWDKKQTHNSIRKDIVEESYEVLDAIENKDINSIVEELGDVLFQILFHISIANQEHEFSMTDITDGISNKMIYRHPHVFGDIDVKDEAEVIVNWNELKKNEKNFESLTDELQGVAKALPSLIRAKKIQNKVKKVGFDWDDINEVFQKVNEELNEVIDVYKSEKMVRIKEEIGDLLFSCVNVSRFLNVDPEEALNFTIEKFIKRFSYIENRAKEMNLELKDMSLSDMDRLWDEAKILEN